MEKMLVVNRRHQGNESKNVDNTIFRGRSILGFNIKVFYVLLLTILVTRGSYCLENSHPSSLRNPTRSNGDPHQHRHHQWRTSRSHMDGDMFSNKFQSSQPSLVKDIHSSITKGRPYSSGELQDVIPQNLNNNQPKATNHVNGFETEQDINKEENSNEILESVLSKRNGDNEDNIGKKETSNIPSKSIFNSYYENTITDKPRKCEYNLIVNEVDSTRCPTLLQPRDNVVQNDNTRTHNQVESSEETKKELTSLKARIADLESKIYQEVIETRELETRIVQQNTVVQRAERIVGYHEQNITMVTAAVKRLEILFTKQKHYFKSLDNKMAGVMLDIVEVNNMLSKRLRPTTSDSNTVKQIAVESTSNARCNIPNNGTRYKDCEDVYQKGHSVSGVYYITPIYSACALPVYCDMTTPPGGWLLIQRRHDGTVPFNRNWTDYRLGFGDVSGEHWLGNDNIFLLTNQAHYMLRVDLWDFHGSKVYAEYLHFRLDGERDRYRMHVSNHSGTAPDGLSNHNLVPFSTPDYDNDAWPDYHCAKEWTAGWWFNNCWFVILNGRYYNKTGVKYRGISWNEWKNEQLMHVEMKIRPSGH